MRRRLPILLTAIALIATGAIAPAIAGGDNGRGFAQGAFHSIGTGGVTLEFGPAAPANPTARDQWDSVRIFAYEGSDSEGQVYCGEVWNVMVTVDFEPFRDWFVGNYSTHTIDGGAPFVAESKTPVRQNGAVGVLTQVHGTFLAPGSLGEGEHKLKGTLEHPFFGVFWDPDPVTIYIDNSTC